MLHTYTDKHQNKEKCSSKFLEWEHSGSSRIKGRCPLRSFCLSNYWFWLIQSNNIEFLQPTQHQLNSAEGQRLARVSGGTWLYPILQRADLAQSQPAVFERHRYISDLGEVATCAPVNSRHHSTSQQPEPTAL